MSRHIVFGTGQVGHPLVHQLLARGDDVVAVNRSGAGDFAGAAVVGGDATDRAFTTEVCAGADVVYFCLNAMSYQRWTAEFPPLQRGVLAGASAAGARLVVLDNLYAYGPPAGRSLVETMEAHPTSAKAATRAAMTDELLARTRRGGRGGDRSRVGLLRSRCDAFGARRHGVRRGVGRPTAQVMGDPDQPHSYSYTPDVAAGLIALGTARDATGQVWHLPVAETRTTRQIIEQVYRLAGHKPRVLAAGRLTLRAVGLVKPEMREYLHTLYQFTDPWVVDDGRFRAAYGDLSTPLDQALAATLGWYADRAASPAR